MDTRKRQYAMILYLIIGNSINLKKYAFEKDCLIVGVDKGAYLAVKSKLQIDYAIGDFDSLNKKETEFVKKSVKNFVQLDPIKDVTDTFYAYKLLNGPANRIVILGGIQGLRIEHFLANINLLKLDKRVVIQDDYSYISRYDAPATADFLTSDYRFFSFFALEKSHITLRGFKYNLDHYLLLENDTLCISNELSSESGTLFLEDGSCIVVQSKDDVAFLKSPL